MRLFDMSVSLVGLLFLLTFCRCVDDTNHRQILIDMSNTGIIIRQRSQYAAMYIPLPDEPTDHVHIQPDLPIHRNINRCLYPWLDNEQLPATYDFNYAASRPDTYGLTYRRALSGIENRTIHTEDILLNLVYSRMALSFGRQYNQEPSNLYLYTYYLPCQNCLGIIRNFLANYRQIRLFVGYSSNENYNATLEGQRRDRLSNILRNRNSVNSLFYIPTRGRCLQSGRRGPRKKRELEDCADNIFILLMDFGTGKAMVKWANQEMKDCKYAIVQLYGAQENKLESRYVSDSTGSKIFSRYMSERFQVRLLCSIGGWGWWRRYTVKKMSFLWDKCGFAKRKLNSVPASYGEVWMWLTIDDGYPKVHLKFSAGKKGISWYDWVAFQNENDAHSNGAQYRMWQYVSRMNREAKNYYTYRFIYRINKNVATGFRVKYVYYSGSYYSGSFRWAGVYDNATPFWTPDGCIGTSDRQEQNGKRVVNNSPRGTRDELLYA